VDDYVKFRPSYPEELMEFIKEQLNFNSDKVTADVGSGTGIFTRLLLKNGNEVFAVEPNAPMRKAAENSLAGNPYFHSVAARAEKTTLPDHAFDFIFSAQAFHWFDPREVKEEFQRILKPTGLVVLIWNERQIQESPFAQSYENLLLKWAMDYGAVTVHGLKSRGVLEDFFGTKVLLQKTFHSSQFFSFEQVKGRLMSASYCPKPGQGGYHPLMDGLEELFLAHQKGNLVEIKYDTSLYYGNLRAV